MDDGRQEEPILDRPVRALLYARSGTVLRIAALVGVFGAVAATALAVPVPVTPQPGALIKPPASPVFTWTVPADEESDALFVADKPDTTTAGAFPAGNVVRAHSFSNGETSWSPGAPLYAGRYWWVVASHSSYTSQRYYSVPRDFTIGLTFEFDRSQVHRSLSRHVLRLTPHWRGNMRALRVKVRLLLHGRIIWAGSALRTNRIGTRGSVTFTWHRPASITQGTVLHVREGLSMPGLTAGGGDGFSVTAP